MVNIIGLGYIGLPTALMMASHGVEVIGTDYQQKLVDTLNDGKVTFKEDGLEELFKNAVDKGIKFSSEYQKADFYIVCVATPYDKESRKIDATYVLSAVKNVLEVCDKNSVIVIESTVSPGTIDKYIRPIIQDSGFICGKDIHIVHAPERIIPGNMVKELIQNSRTIGADDKAIGEKVKDIYKTFCKGDIEVTDIRTAEMTKVVENTYRDINIAFANELLKICRSDNLDVHEIIRIANKHPRVNILSPGPGVGGHCISVDPWFLVGDYPEIARLIRLARETNDSMPDYVLERVCEIAKEKNVSFDRVGFYGITYKEDVDDLRDSPTLQLIEKMNNHLCNAPKVFDPMIEEKIIENQYLDFERFLNYIDIMVVMVSHSHLNDNAELIKGKTIFDTRNCCDKLTNANEVIYL